MDGVAHKDRLLSLYPVFARFSETGMAELIAAGRVRAWPAGTCLFDERAACTDFPLLLDGTIRVSKLAVNGREIQLYRVSPGEVCVLTSGCLLGGAPYSARGVAETLITLFSIPAPLFVRLLSTEPEFRNYVFSLFSERLSDLMQLVEAVAFQRLDRRLAALLLDKGTRIHTTHQHLADELGSVREIVTRLLRGFADQGLVSISREQIELLDARRLRKIAET